MIKALVCASVSMRLYLRSGRILIPLLLLIGYPLLFYHIQPVEKGSSFSLSTIVAFLWGAWIALSMLWSEEKTLRQIFIVKTSHFRYCFAQTVWLMACGAAGGLFLVLLPMLMHLLYLPNLFVDPPTASEWALAILWNGCVGLCAASFAALFQPRFLRDRKIAYTVCLLLGILGLVDGLAGLPFGLRLLLPPIYDTLIACSDESGFTEQTVLRNALWYCGYASACALVQAIRLRRTEE